MLQPVLASNCYCCTRPTESKSRMDIDCALNELGMLSTVTQSRKEYMLEKQKSLTRKMTRERYTSDPGLPDNSSDEDKLAYNFSTALLTDTPQNSPVKPGYHILQINRQFVTDVSTCGPLNANLHPSLCPSTSAMQTSLGDFFCSDSVYQKNKQTSTFNPKPTSRSRRFRKPYEVPWRYNIEKFYTQKPVTTTMPIPRIGAGFCSKSQVSTSNSSTPEKNHSKSHLTSAQRSKSLDELEFSKLHMADNDNISLGNKEVDRVSTYFKDLHVV